jgi:hypothetical protein
MVTVVLDVMPLILSRHVLEFIEELAAFITRPYIYIFIGLHDVTSQKTAVITVTAVGAPMSQKLIHS